MSDESSQPTYRDTMSRLNAAQKSAKGAPAYSRFINRPMGRRFAAVAYMLGMTPNQVTALSALCTYSAIALLAIVEPVWWLGVVISALLVVGYGLDAADGQLARLRGGGGPSGEWLDHMVDAGKIVLMHQVVLVSFLRFGRDATPHPTWLLIAVPMLFTVVSVVGFFAQLLNEQLRRGVQAKVGATAVPQEAPNTLRSLMVLPTDYGVLCLAFALWGWMHIFVFAYAFLALGTAGYLFLALIRWFGQMRELDHKVAA